LPFDFFLYEGDIFTLYGRCVDAIIKAT